MKNEKTRGIFWATLLGIALAVLGGKSAPRIYADNQQVEQQNSASLRNIAKQEQRVANRPWEARLRLFLTESGQYHLILSEPQGAENPGVNPLKGNGPQAGKITRNCTLRITLPSKESRTFVVTSVYKDTPHLAGTDWYRITHQGEKFENLTYAPNVKVIPASKWEIVRS